MKYLKYDAEPGKIIKHYTVNGSNYKIDYMDGSTGAYFCSNEDEESRLIDLMISQAKDRNNDFRSKEEKQRLALNVCGFVYSLMISGGFVEIDNHFLATIMGLVACLFGVSLVEKIKKSREVNKYDLFFEMMEDLDVVNNSKFLEEVEFDHFYQKPFDINNIDDYSFAEVKALYRKLQKEKV